MRDKSARDQSPSRASRRWMASFANLAVGEAATSVMRLAATAVVARRLGPSRFGVLSIAVVVGAYVALVAHSGLDIGGTRVVAEDPTPRRVRDRLEAIVGLRLLLACAGYGLLVASVALLPLSRTERFTIAGFALVVFTQALDVRWVFIGLQKTRPAALVSAASSAMFLIGTLLFVHGPPAIGVFVALFLGAELFSASALWLITWRMFGRWWPRIPTGEVWSLTRSSFPITVTRCARTVVIALDVVIVGIFRSDSDTGYYGLAGRCVAVGITYVGLYYHAYLPALTSVLRNPAEVDRMVASARRRAALMAPVIVGVGVLASPIAVSVLFGRAYRPAIGLIQIMLLSLLFLIPTGVYTGVLFAYQESARLARIAVAATLLNLATNLALVPTIGAVGASWATVVAEAFTFILTARTARRVLARRRSEPRDLDQDLGGRLGTFLQ